VKDISPEFDHKKAQELADKFNAWWQKDLDKYKKYAEMITTNTKKAKGKKK